MVAFINVFRKKFNVTVVIGTNDLSKVNERTMRYNVIRKCKHADFDNSSLVNDIMMLKVRTYYFYFYPTAYMCYFV